ncbi:MAG: NAD(P)H-quinone dehydrogenase [Actinobacteria bacterium]|jgi:dihydrolipoamide dehydrogenase|nr:NAD(P)H-quinone dehydrogenase [Actinomycetota bacterium]
MPRVTSVVIVGGGPGGYEAALVARQLGADVTLVHSDGLGGSAVLTDAVPSKALIATANVITEAATSATLGVLIHGRRPDPSLVGVDLTTVNRRIKALAAQQSADIGERLKREGVRTIHGRARFGGPDRIVATRADGTEETLDADVSLLATGARPRILADAQPDGERILTWEQVYDLPDVPERLIVVGSGVTGAEFAGAYHALGSRVVLISSREHVLPSEDPDAAKVLEEVYGRRGLEVLSRSRAVAARRTDGGVEVTLSTGHTVQGSHVLMAVGSLPNTDDLDLAAAGVEVDERGFIGVDRVSRTSRRGVYAAGDCTGVLMLASVAAMQGRIAMWHALGDAVAPLELSQVSSTVFTNPEIATVGLTQADLDAGRFRGDVAMVALAPNARAKMADHTDGFVKLFCRRGSRILAGAVIVGPYASELILPLTIAVEQRLTVDQLAATFTVYPSLSGSIAEAARRLRGSTE